MAIPESLIQQFRNILGSDGLNDTPNQLAAYSKDYYWFSPVLVPELESKQAEIIVHPRSVDEMRAVIAATAAARVPLTLRGAGTGNYGQGVPMQGGVLLSTTRMNRILSIDKDKVRAEAGTKLLDIERTARTHGAEMRFYPSTLATSTVAGFVAGGAGGIGSVNYGTLWDEGNVLGATIITMEAQPRTIVVNSYEDLRAVVHSCGLTCAIADITLALAPAKRWAQFAATFDELDTALRFGYTLAYDDTVDKRLLSVFEWPIPGYFKPLLKHNIIEHGKASVFMELEMPADEVEERVAAMNGRLTWHSPHEHYHAPGRILLSDYTWNHTTLWAIKQDPKMTYLQDSFDRDRCLDQIRHRKEKYGDSVLHHIEFFKWFGNLIPQGLSLVKFESRQQLWDMMAHLESIGQFIANPHSHCLDDDARWNGQPVLDAKKQWDPHTLLNPGHLRSLERSA